MIKILLMIGLAVVLMSGCITHRDIGEDGYEIINSKESAQLVERARNVIFSDKKNVLENQLRFIQNNEPDVRISYRDNCYGKAIISWRIESDKKTFRVVFTGLLISDEPDDLSIRYNVIRETDQQTIPDDGSRLRPELDFSRREWLELKKQ